MTTQQYAEADKEKINFFVQDAQNTIIDHLAVGFERLYSITVSAIEEGESTDSIPNEQGKAQFREGMRRLYNIVHTRASNSVDLLGQVIATNILQPSVRIALPNLDPVQLGEGVSSSLTGGAESEEELLEKIASMRRELVQAQRRCNILAQELRAVDQEIARYGDATQYLAAAAIAASNKEAVLEVAERAAELQGLLERAKSLRQSSAIGEKVKGTFKGLGNNTTTNIGAVAALAKLRGRTSGQDA